MSVTVQNCSIAAYITAAETGSPGALSAGTPMDSFKLSNNATNPDAPVKMTIGTGTTISVNVVASTKLSLAAAAQDVDMKALVTALGTKAFGKVRGFFFQNLATAESGHSVAITAGTSNGFAALMTGTTPALIIPAQGVYLLLNPQIAAWTVDTSHKVLTFDPGANTGSFVIGIVGE